MSNKPNLKSMGLIDPNQDREQVIENAQSEVVVEAVSEVVSETIIGNIDQTSKLASAIDSDISIDKSDKKKGKKATTIATTEDDDFFSPKKSSSKKGLGIQMDAKLWDWLDNTYHGTRISKVAIIEKALSKFLPEEFKPK